jgi:FixJ family two-component response regulator
MSDKPLIAVVDDDLAILKAMDRLIRSHGCAAITFSSGAEFLRFAAVTPPDCVILDIQMPDQTGVEVHEHMRARGQRVPVIYITAHEDEAVEQQTQQKGSYGFFHKPFRNEHLWKAVRSAITPPEQDLPS